MSVVDLNFVTDGTIDRIIKRRNRWQEINRECARRHIGHAFDEAEAALDFLGDLKRAGHNIELELDECEGTLKAFLLQIMVLRGNHE